MNWTQMSWVEKLRVVENGAEAKLSASQLASQMENCSRSAILGFAYRHRIRMQGKSYWRGKTSSKPKKARKPKVIKKPEPVLSQEPLDGTGVLFELRHKTQCAWIINDDLTNAVCCGQPVDKGHWQEYCPYHAKIGTGQRGVSEKGKGGWVK